MRPLFTISFLFLSMLWVITVSASGTPGEIEFARGDFEAAKIQLEGAYKKQPDDASILLLLGRTHMSLRNTEAAAKHFAMAIEAAPDSPDAHYWYGRANGQLASNASIFRAGGFAKKARRGFETAMQLDPKHIGAYRGMIEYYTNAPRLFGGSTDAAIESAKKLQTIDTLEGRLALVDIYQDDDRDDEARAQLEAITREHPNDPRGFFSLGYIEQTAENYAKAHALFSRAAAMSGENEDAEDARKSALYQLGRTAVLSKQNVDDGITAYKEYLLLPTSGDLPDKAWAHFRLGTLYELEGESELANDHFDMASKTKDKDLKRRLASK